MDPTVKVFENFLRPFDPADVSTLMCVQTAVLLREGREPVLLGSRLITTRKQEEEFLYAVVGVAAAAEEPLLVVEIETAAGESVRVDAPLSHLQEIMNA